jgi:hypothetical protein
MPIWCCSCLISSFTREENGQWTKCHKQLYWTSWELTHQCFIVNVDTEHGPLGGIRGEGVKGRWRHQTHLGSVGTTHQFCLHPISEHAWSNNSPSYSFRYFTELKLHIFHPSPNVCCPLVYFCTKEQQAFVDGGSKRLACGGPSLKGMPAYDLSQENRLIAPAVSQLQKYSVKRWSCSKWAGNFLFHQHYSVVSPRFSPRE